MQVANGDEHQRQEVLEDQQGGGVGSPFLNRGPALHADEMVADGEGEAQVLEGQGEHAVREKRHGDEARHDPGDGHGQVGLAQHGLPSGGVDDELVALHGDEDQGEDGHGHGHALDEGRDLTQSIAQDPAVHQRVDDGDRQANDAHEDVGAGQVDDEDVGDVAHLLVPQDDEHQARVADESDRHDGAVSDDEEGGAPHQQRAVIREVPPEFLPRGLVVELRLHDDADFTPAAATS